MRLGTHYGNDSNTVAIAKYAQGLIGSPKDIRATKQGNNQASSAMDTKLLLFTNSLKAVMSNMVILDPTMFGMESRLVWMTLNPRLRNDRVKYWLTGYFGMPNKRPRAYNGHMS